MNENATLGSLAERGILALGDGYRTRKDQLGPEGIPILRVADVLDGIVAPSFKDHILDDYRPKMGAKISRPGDVLITTKGTVGRVAVMPDDIPEHSYSPQLCFLRVEDPSAVHPGWLYQWARSPLMQQQLDMYKGQTDMAPYVSLGDLRSFAIDVPPVEDQQRIAHALGALDDLIEHNRRLIGELVDLAVAVGTHAAGSAVRVRDVATLSRGLSYKGSGLSDATNTSARALVNLANISTGPWWKPDGLKFYTEAYKPAHVLREADLLLANTDLTQRREVLGRGLIVPPRLIGALYSHHTTRVNFVPDQDHLKFALWAQLQSSSFRERARGFATGTTVTALPQEAVLDFEMTAPSDGSVVNRIEAMLRQAWGLEDEVDDLTRCRDELLPILMTGLLRVSDVEGLVA